MGWKPSSIPVALVRAAILTCVLGLSAYADASTRRGLPLRAELAGEPTQIMVLGSAHLAGWPENFDLANLEPLLVRLAAWQPQRIAIEAISGVQCAEMERLPDRYAQTVADYCPNRADALRATGLDPYAASLAAERLLKTWPLSPTPGQRRQLAALWLAAGDRASALVQWLRLPEGQRVAGDGLDSALVGQLVALQNRRNENYAIAAVLAARLGLERVYPVDDHTSDLPFDDDAAATVAIQRAWANPASDQRRRADAEESGRLGTGSGVLAAFRGYNNPANFRVIFDSDFGAALREGSAQHYGRMYVAGWETRNLRMVASLRDATQDAPGVRLLAIVGASHKPYYERYLSAMHDVELADTYRWLGR